MPEVVVAGGGYAGLQVVLKTARTLPSDWKITLVDRSSGHQLITRLPEVVGGSLSPTKACIPFQNLLPRRVRFVQADVRAIDPAERLLVTSVGSLHADRLVVALGSKATFLGVPGAAEHGLVLKSVADAKRMRAAVEAALRTKQTVHIVIVGAGYTGTEVAGDLAEWGAQLAPGRMTVTVVAQDPRLMPEGNPALSQIAERVLRRKGVQFHLETTVQSIGPDRVESEAGILPADVVVWAAHSAAALPPARPAWLQGRDNRVEVDPYLRASGYAHVYVAGDDALTYDYSRDRPVPSSAQAATQEGNVVAHNLVAEIQGSQLEEFRPVLLGEALSLGNGDSAADIAGVVVSGRAAVVAKRAALVRYLTALGGIRLARLYT